jgi:hypothetical protein
MRIAEKAAEIGARGVLERVSFDDDKGVVYLDERSGQWKRLSNIDLATDSIVRALDLGAITGRKVMNRKVDCDAGEDDHVSPPFLWFCWGQRTNERHALRFEEPRF